MNTNNGFIWFQIVETNSKICIKDTKGFIIHTLFLREYSQTVLAGKGHYWYSINKILFNDYDYGGLISIYDIKII